MDKVLYYDVDSGKVVRIPAAELRPGAVRARVQGIDDIVWLLPERLKTGPLQHPPFTEDVRAYIRHIQATFAEHRDLSFEEWEDGFRRDAYPEQEIAIWSHAAEAYSEFVDSGEWSEEERDDAYRVIAACLTASPDTVWHVIHLEVLSRDDAERIVHRFYGTWGQAKS